MSIHNISNHQPGIIVYQLHAWSTWYQRYGELLELALFCMVLHPYLLKTQHLKILNLIEFKNSTKSNEHFIADAEVVHLLGRLKEQLLQWMDMRIYRVDNLVKQFERMIETVKFQYNQPNIYRTLVENISALSTEILESFSEMKDGEALYRSLKFGYLKLRYFPQNSTTLLEDFIEAWKIALSQAIHFNCATILDRQKAKRNVKKHSDDHGLRQLTNSCQVLDDLYEIRLTQIREQIANQSCPTPPYLTEGIVNVSRLISIQKRILLDDETNQVVYKCCDPYIVYQREMSQMIYIMVQLCSTHSRIISPVLYGEAVPSQELPDLVNRAYSLASRGYRVNRDLIHDRLINQRITECKRSSIEPLLLHYQDQLFTVTTVREMMAHAYRTECDVLVGVKLISNQRFAVEVVETHLEYLEQAMNAILECTDKYPDLALECVEVKRCQEDIAIHRWAANVFCDCDYSDQTCIETLQLTKSLHTRWFEWRSTEKTVSLTSNQTINSSTRQTLISLIQICIRIQLMTYSMNMWKRSNRSWTVVLEELGKESFSVCDTVKIAKIEEWIEMLTQCYGVIDRVQQQHTVTKLDNLKECLFWLEKRIEIAVLFVSSDIDDVRRSGKSNPSSELAIEQWTKVQWIIDRATKYAVPKMAAMYIELRDRLNGVEDHTQAGIIAINHMLQMVTDIDNSISVDCFATILIKQVIICLEEARCDAYQQYVASEEQMIKKGTFGKIVGYDSVLALFKPHCRVQR